MDEIINGRGRTDRIVSVAHKRDAIHVYTENEHGVQLKVVPYKPWVLADCELDENYSQLDGENEYKYIRFFSSVKSWREHRREWKHSTWSPRSIVDQYLLSSGETFHKGMKRQEVSVLSWDIETAGLKHDENSRVYLIANTYRKGDYVERKLFDLSEYDSQRHFFDAWCAWVREKNPSIMLGHNLYVFDIPYVLYCASRCGAEIRLGRDGSALELELFEAKYRVDGTRNISYRTPVCFGRQVLDTMFLMMSADVAKKYTSYGLKSLIKEAGLERQGRTMVDAGRIWEMWSKRHSNPDQWEAVREYARFDGDDALALWDLCGDSFFYPASQIPMTLERVCMSASGAQINAQLVRAYLADGHSIPKASEKRPFEGAISKGYPGIYRHTISFDVASLYPSIIITYEVYDRKKDPRGYVLHMVKEYRKQRLEYKKLAAAGDKYYEALDATAKRSLNSFFGFFAAKSANYNSMDCAEFITRQGRDILLLSVSWAKGEVDKNEVLRLQNLKFNNG